MEKLLKVAKQILWEIEENPTIRENRKIGMKVAVGYMLDEVYRDLFKMYREGHTDKTIEELELDFEMLIGYSQNDVIEKQFQNLNNYFISLNTKQGEIQ